MTERCGIATPKTGTHWGLYFRSGFGYSVLTSQHADAITPKNIVCESFSFESEHSVVYEHMLLNLTSAMFVLQLRRKAIFEDWIGMSFLSLERVNITVKA